MFGLTSTFGLLVYISEKYSFNTNTPTNICDINISRPSMIIALYVIFIDMQNFKPKYPRCLTKTGNNHSITGMQHQHQQQQYAVVVAIIKRQTVCSFVNRIANQI